MTNATNNAAMNTIKAQAMYAAMRHSLPVFVYQTGVDRVTREARFNFRFVEPNPACGVLVARFDKDGHPF